MKKLLISIAAIIILIALQFFTYNTIASDELTKKVIRDLKPNKELKSDTVIFNWIISICGNYKEKIKPYNLHLYTQENQKLIQNRLVNCKVVNAREYAKYCNEIVDNTPEDNRDEAWFEYVNSLYKNVAELSITALEEKIFFVNVETSWDRTLDSFHNQRYLWILFTWIKI